MTDMMAALLGAGSGKAAQVLASLGGKAGAKGLPVEAGGGDPGAGGDPFMAVLFGRLDALQGPAGDGLDPAALAPGAETLEPGTMPLKPLEVALLHAQANPAEAAFQQALAMPGPMQDAQPKSSPAAQPRVEVPGLEGEPLAAIPPGHPIALAAQSKSPDANGKSAAKHPTDAADSAVEGQLLPPGRVEPGMSERTSRPEWPGASPGPSQSQGPLVAASSVTQALAAQVSPAGQEPALQTPVQGGQPMVGGLGIQGEGVLRPPQAPVQLAVEAPLRSPLFPQELGERVVWLSSRQGQVAEIALNPPHLGPLEVRLSLSGGEAGAQFYSPHASVREAIESALPRLREMLAEAGVTLGQAQVRDEALPRQAGFARDDENRAHSGEEGGNGVQSAEATLSGAIRVGTGLVDLYI